MYEMMMIIGRIMLIPLIVAFAESCKTDVDADTNTTNRKAA